MCTGEPNLGFEVWGSVSFFGSGFWVWDIDLAPQYTTNPKPPDIFH